MTNIYTDLCSYGGWTELTSYSFSVGHMMILQASHDFSVHLQTHTVSSVHQIFVTDFSVSYKQNWQSQLVMWFIIPQRPHLRIHPSAFYTRFILFSPSQHTLSEGWADTYGQKHTSTPTGNVERPIHLHACLSVERKWSTRKKMQTPHRRKAPNVWCFFTF